MANFGGVSDGFSLFKDSIKVLFRYPILLFPIFVSWFLVSGIILYERYYMPFPRSFRGALFVVFMTIFLITLIINVANIIMLELVEQIETSGKTRFFEALGSALFRDFLKVIPVSLIWSIIWFILLIIQILLSKSKKRSSSRPKPSLQDAAMTLGGANSGPFSWLKLGLNMFKKLVRMTIFMSLPGIAWENKGPFKSLSKSVDIIKKHPVEFLTEYSLTFTASLLMAIPLIPILFAAKAGVSFPPIVWTIVLIYESIIWTLGIYLEQMSVGLLYMWHLKWEKYGSKGDLSKIKKPSLLNDIPELFRA